MGSVSGILHDPHTTTGFLTCLPFPKEKVQATGPTWRCSGWSLLSTLSQQHCLPAKLLSQEPIPLLSVSEASRIHYHSNVGGLLQTSEFCLCGGLPGALEEEHSLWNRRHSEHPCRWAEALCSTRPGGCYGKQPTCLCHSEHGRAIVRF